MQNAPAKSPAEYGFKRPSDYALQVWTMVARRGMTPSIAARHLDTSIWRVERILVGVSRRNARRW